MNKQFPEDIEYRYSKELIKIVDLMHDKLIEIISIRKNSNLEEDEEQQFLDYFEEYLSDEFCYNIAIDYSIEAVEYAINRTNNQIKAIKGISFKEQAFYDEKTLKKQIAEQVKLIKAEPGKYLRTFDKQVSKLVKEKVEEGKSLKTLTEAIELATGIEKNRANLIARDQIGKVFGEATKTQFKGIGLNKFEWITVGDSRVRDSHIDRAGKIYYWDDPPDGEIPGSAIACRCVASVVVDEVLNL